MDRAGEDMVPGQTENCNSIEVGTPEVNKASGPVLVVVGRMSSSGRKLERSRSVSSRSDQGHWVRVPGLVVLKHSVTRIYQ